MNFKKRVNGSWVDTPHYIHNTSTDTITTLPADIYANDNNATVGLKGQMEQNGTPTPDSPIQPSECGERTGNLFDADRWYGVYKLPDGTYQAKYANFYAIKAKPFSADDIGRTFTFSMNISPIEGNVRISANVNGTVINGTSRGGRTIITFTVLTVDDTIFLNYGALGDTVATLSNIMLNTGSTALPYEPWGVKIPILSNSTTTPVYLGEVQSTRRIKKLVLDGTENWDDVNLGYESAYFRLKIGEFETNIQNLCLCTHFEQTIITTSTTNVGCNIICSSTLNYDVLAIRPNIITALSDFTSWLSTQYANGTPVTVWYVLATPTTGIVNEPLMKIGDYADEVSGITIPTIAGANTIDVDTTLKPSEVSVNYHGWHLVSAVHERENGQWD